MQVRSKLFLNTIIIIFCLSTVGGIGYYYTHNVANLSLLISELEAIPILKINELEATAWERWLLLIKHSGISDYEVMQNLEVEMKELDKQIKVHLGAIDNIYTLHEEEASEHARTLNSFKSDWQQFQKIAAQILALSQDFTKEDALGLIVKDGTKAYEKANTNLRNLIKQHRNNMEVLRDNALQARWDAAIMIALLTFLISLFALILVNRFTQKLLTPLLLINSQLKLLAQGREIQENIEYKGDDEIAEIVLSSIQLKDSIEDTIKQANAIASGNYEYAIELRSKEDRLGQALYDMTSVLREITSKNDIQTSKNDIQNWLKTGQTQLHEQMSGDLTLVDLAHNVISFLTLYVEGQIGICYLVEKSSDDFNQNIGLKQIASYAYTRRKNMGDEFEFSEGLVARTAKSQKTIAFSFNIEISDDMPQHIFMTPFLYENVVKGVLVFGSIKPLTQIQQDFLDQVMTGIGIAFNSIEARTKMQELLQQTQIQAQELTEQKEALQAQTGELQSKTVELQTQSEELQAQQEELRQTNEILEERGRDLESQKAKTQDKNLTLESNRIEMEKSQAAIVLKAEELELASKYKSEFLANMSHELRTPLNSLLILAQLLAEDKAGNLNEKQIEYAKTINSAGKDLLTLINDILDLSKVEAGKVEVVWENVLLPDLLAMIEQKFLPIAENKELKFTTTIDVNPTLRTDGQRLQQIINNLLSNAFKFTEAGSIRIVVQYPTEIPTIIEGNKLKLNKTISFSVIDTGVGIPKDKQQAIFEAFQQVDGSTSRRYGGTGLGLSISRQLARLLGGELTLTSEEGKGTTFTLYLPIAQLQSKPQTKQDVSKNTLTQNAPENAPIQVSEAVTQNKPMADDRNTLQSTDKSILIVEDDQNFVGILVELARGKEFKCLIAGDGISGLQLAKEYKPNAIILDVGLPKLDGWTVMDRLKDDSTTRHIPVHFISGADNDINAQKKGAIGYLTKPVSVEQLGETFQKIEQFLSATMKNLLLITDVKSHQHKIMELIGDEHVKIELAATIGSVCQHVKTTAYDCIILDMDIENGSGSKLLKEMQQEKSSCQIPIIVYADRELTPNEEALLLHCAAELPIKSVRSPERLLDEATLFLHQVEANLPVEKRNMLQMIHDKSTILKHKKVLIVDDDMRNSFALTTVLENHDMEIVIGANGKEGLAVLGKHDDIAIVLMDIMMPEMDGYEAMREIRKQYKYHSLPIIALTAKAMKDDRIKCIEAGANDYLAKPIDVDKLMSLMRVWLYR